MTLKKKRDAVVNFRDRYREYIELKRLDRRSPQQDKRMQDLRSEINRAVPIVTSYIQDVGEPTTVYYAPSPAVGGFAGQVDLLANIFIPSLPGLAQTIFDMLDRGIGRYDFFIENRWKKWLNPFHWVGEIIRVPFHVLRFAGFDASKIELSIFGKVYKVVVGLVALLSGLVTVYVFVKPYLSKFGIDLP